MVKPANTIETAMLGKLGCWNYQNQTGKHAEPICNWIQNWLIYIRGARCTWTKNSGKPWCLNHSAKSQATVQKVRPFDSGPPLGAVLPQIPATLGQLSSLLWFPLRFQPHVCPRSLSWASISCDPESSRTFSLETGSTAWSPSMSHHWSATPQRGAAGGSWYLSLGTHEIRCVYVEIWRNGISGCRCEELII